MLYGTITLNSTVYRIAEDGFADVHYHDAYILDFTAPTYKTRDVYGGYCELTFGDIDLSPDLFVGEWPPPINAEVELKYTDTTEAAGSTIFEGTAHLNEVAITKNSIGYDLYGVEHDTELLAETTDYYGNTDIPIPRAIGTIEHQNPLRLADVSGNPTHHKAYLSGSLTNLFTAVANNGSGNCRFTSTAHGFGTGNSVTIEGVNRQYDGTYSITVIDANTFDITLTYVSTTTGHAYTSTMWRVYDDGVPISGNVTDNGDGTFSLSASAVGEITISGTGSWSTLVNLFTSACGASWLNLTCNTTNARATTINLGFWANSQMLVIDFLSDASAYCTHLFYISGTTLYLVDMLIDNGSRTINEFEFFDSTHSYNPPVKQVKSEWLCRTAVEETIGKYIKDTIVEVAQQSVYPYGEEMAVVPFQTEKADIKIAINNILTNIHLPSATVDIPFQGGLPVPGERISWTNASLGMSTDVYIRCRHLRYDPINDTVSITGDGGLAAT